MKFVSCLLLISLPVFGSRAAGKNEGKQKKCTRNNRVDSVYKVYRLKNHIKINANWDAAQWKKIKSFLLLLFFNLISFEQQKITVRDVVIYDSISKP